MKKKILFLASFLGIFLIGSQSQAGELRSTVGTVEVQREGTSVWLQGRPKTTVFKGDIVRTGRGSKTKINFDQGHQLTLKEKTTLQIESDKKNERSFKLVVGRIRAFVKKLKLRSKFRVKTPVAVASVRGTIFEIEVLEDQSSRLSVLKGSVSYRDLAGIGQEVTVFKGQSVLIEPGAAPRPIEPLPADLQQGLVPDQREQTAQFNLKSEIQREAAMASFKEFFQTDFANEIKTAQYQERKTVVDAFGKRVRLEQYITRPDPKQFSFIALNTRENRLDYTRFDVYAKNALPGDLGSVNLYSGSGHDSMTNWVEKTHRLSTNGGDYYREWQDGGAPINMTDGNSQYQQVVFSNWFAELKANGAAPVLLSHWVPDLAFSGGNPTATRVRDQADVALDGLLDIPAGYLDFESADAGSVVGNDRPIDSAGFTNTQRLDYFTNGSVSASYTATEGYSRTSGALFNDIAFANATLGQVLGSTKVSRLSTYTVPGGSDITLQVDQYSLLDDGTLLNFKQAATLGSSVEGINQESVFTSSLTGGRKIDIVVSPKILKEAGF